uniref:Uncharacterized protein n=1 Tax=Sphaerodactylus townsendi TaxID=933632 RepID=A0ACB8FWQ2_9SAUR
MPEESARPSPGQRLPALPHRHRSRPRVAKGRGPQPPENPPLKCNVINLSLQEGCGSEHLEAGRQRLPALPHLAKNGPRVTKGQSRPTALETLPRLPSIVAGGLPKQHQNLCQMREERLRSALLKHQLEACNLPWTGAVARKNRPGGCNLSLSKERRSCSRRKGNLPLRRSFHREKTDRISEISSAMANRSNRP